MKEIRQPKKETKEIGGHSFTVYMLPPRKALLATLNVAAVFGGIVSKLIQSGGKEENIIEKLPELISEIGKVPEDKLNALIDVLREVTVVEEKGFGPLDKCFDEVFENDLKSMILWLWFATNVNFGEFFRGAFKDATTKSQ
jgi:hypothetical protein